MTNAEAYPDYVARFYDAVYDKIRSSVDHNYYLRKAIEAKGRVLEVGVGTGRFFCEALETGVDAYGIDISPSMIDRLRDKLTNGQRERVRVADVRTFAWEGSFDLILAPFRVFGHLVDPADQLAALENIRHHLSDQGRLIFDVFVPDPVLCHQGLAPTIDFEGEWSPGHRLRRTVSVTPQPERQINLARMLFEWEEDGQTHEAVWEFPMRYFYRYELEHLIVRSGLVLEALYGDFHEGLLEPHSKDFLLICHKPH